MSTQEIIDAFENLRYFESTCKVEWGRVQAEADRAIKALKQVENNDLLHDVIPSSLVRKVVFFQLKEDGKYYAEDGTEITTDMLMKYPHYITNDDCYLMLN